MALTRPNLENILTNVAIFTDSMTVLHAGATQANVDVGFLMNRANGLVPNAAFYWSESTQSFVTALTANAGVTASNIVATSYAPVTTGNLNVQGNLSVLGTVTYLSTNTETINGIEVVAGNLVANSGTTSTSTSTGALVVVGGAGLSGALYVGSTVSASAVYAGTIGNTGATLNGTFGTVTGTVPSATTATNVTGLTAANVQAVIGSVSAGSFPTLNQNTTGTAANATNAVVAQVVTGLTAANVQAVIGSVSAGSFPILNQNTTGTAANATNAVVAQVVTGLTAANVQAVIGSVSTASFPTLNQNTTGSSATAGTVTTAAQPAITSVGTLTGLTVSGLVTQSSTTALAPTAILTHGADVNFQLTAQNGTSTNTTGQEVARFGINYNTAGWDSFTQYIRGSNAQNGNQVFWAANTAIATVSTGGIALSTGAFSGAGTGLTGTASSLSIGGSAATVTAVSQPNITTLAGLTSFGTAGVNTTAQGNLTVAGNLTVTGNITTTGNVTNITITGNSGQFFGNVQGFGALYAGIGTGYTIQPFTVIQSSGNNANGDAQINNQNISNGSGASTDFVATADNGSNSDTYIDMGINSSGYNQPSGFSLTYPNDGYLYVQGNTTTGGGNLILATMTPTNAIIFATGGQNANNEVMRVTAANVVAIKGSATVTGTINSGTVIASTINAPTIGNTGTTITGSTASISTWANIAGPLALTNNTAVDSLQITGTATKGGAGYHDFLSATNLGGGTNINKYFRLDSSGTLQIINSAYSATIFSLTDAGALTVPGVVSVGNITTTNGVFWSNGAAYSSGGGSSFNGGTVTGATSFTNTTTSTSNSTGAVIVSGGVGITGNLNAGAASGTLQHQLLSGSQFAPTVGTFLAGAHTVHSGSGGNYLAMGQYPSGGASQYGQWIQSGYPASSGAVYYPIILNPLGGNVVVGSTTASTSTTTGALVVAGGLGVAGAAYLGSVYDSGNRVLSTSSGAGNLSISGTAVTLTATGPGATTVGSSTAIPVVTTDAYGRVSTLTTAAVVAPAGTLSGSTLASGVTASSLTSVGTLTSGAIGTGFTAIPNSALSNSSVTIGSTAVALGATATTVAGLTLTSPTLTTPALGTPSSGNFSTGTFTWPTFNQNTTGSAGSAPAGSLTGTTLASGVTASSLTSVGTLTSLTVSGSTSVTSTSAGALNIGTSSAINSFQRSQVGPALGTAAGNQTLLSTLNVNTGNQDYLEITNTRYAAGTSWTTAGMRLQQKVDATWMGWMQFNTSLANGGIVWGTGTNTTSGNLVPARVVLDSSGNFYPVGNVSQTLGSTTAWWSTIYGTSTHAQYADLAENYLADEEYAPGTVVVFGGDEEITTTTQSHDPRVAGVISTNPAYLMNASSGGLPVAMTGRVPCLVQGPVTKGQVLVTSTVAGVAQAIDNSQFVPGCVVGKTLAAINTNTIETIEVVVGRF